MSNTLVSIIIVTCGAGDYLENCLKSILKQTFARLEIVIIDNSSDPRVQSRIASLCPSAAVYAEKQNLYYCAGLNKGISKSTGDFILCLNDDCVLDPLYIQYALMPFDDPRIGMVSGKIMRPDKSTIDSTGLFLSAFRTARERGYNMRDKGQFQTGGSVFGATGACALYRAAMVKEISVNGDFFDEDFQMFFEDLDVSWRAQRFGWKGYYNPAAVAYHVRGGTARQKRGHGKKFARMYLDDTLHRAVIKNRYSVILKNESFPGFLLHLPCIVLYDVCTWLFIAVFNPRFIAYMRKNPFSCKSAVRKRGVIQKLLKNRPEILIHR